MSWAKARRLVAAEEHEALEARVRAKAAELAAAASRERAARERAAADRRADTAEAACQRHAPSIVMTYGDVKVHFALRGKDGNERLAIAEAARRAERILTAAFKSFVTRQRAQAVTGNVFPADPLESGLVERLNEELHYAIRLGHCEVKS